MTNRYFVSRVSFPPRPPTTSCLRKPLICIAKNMHIRISWGNGGAGWVGGGGRWLGGQYFIKTFPFSMHFNSKNGQFYPNLGFKYTLFGKNCFHNMNDGSLEVHSNKNCAIYWTFIFHHFVGKFTLLPSEVLNYLTLSTLCKIFSRRHFKTFFLFCLSRQ